MALLRESAIAFFVLIGGLSLFLGYTTESVAGGLILFVLLVAIGIAVFRRGDR
jgi:hypothetical protein